jgi:GT2 family glycosyltransferase
MASRGETGALARPCDTAPTVSAVMIFRDAAAFIEEAARSVLAQTLPNVELVLVDDGSVDESTDIAREFAAAYSDRVLYVEHPGHANRGMSASRNLGVARSSAALIAFLDADDRWDATHLAHQVEMLDAHPSAGMVCGPAFRWKSWEGGTDSRSPVAYAPGTVVPPGRMLTAALRRGEFTVPTCSVLVRRSVWDQAGGAEDAFTGMFEDQVLLAKLHLVASSVLTENCTAWYRQHGSSATARALAAGEYHPEQPNVARLRYLDWLERQVTHAPALDDETVRELRTALADARSRLGRRSHVVAKRYAQQVPEPLRRALRGMLRLRTRGSVN